MAPLSEWYDNTVFYHIYPLGLLGAPHENHGVYIGPLFESSRHGYDTIDYRMVDRRLGDQEDFKVFVRSCHEAGIRVVVDGVFNHTGREFFAFRDIQKNREQSRYKDWYKGINFGWDSAYHDGFSYETWRGSGLPV